jgi:hypothetical protein
MSASIRIRGLWQGIAALVGAARSLVANTPFYRTHVEVEIHLGGSLIEYLTGERFGKRSGFLSIFKIDPANVRFRGVPETDDLALPKIEPRPQLA